MNIIAATLTPVTAINWKIYVISERALNIIVLPKTSSMEIRQFVEEYIVCGDLTVCRGIHRVWRF